VFRISLVIDSTSIVGLASASAIGYVFPVKYLNLA
jgi:hypothetical protein